ncbi:MAG: hypothetical protein E6J90_36965, partial [Deltaproteobacteria bacterium]
MIRQIARRLAKEAAGAKDTDDADLPPDLFAQVQVEAATTGVRRPPPPPTRCAAAIGRAPGAPAPRCTQA